MTETGHNEINCTASNTVIPVSSFVANNDDPCEFSSENEHGCNSLELERPDLVAPSFEMHINDNFVKENETENDKFKKLSRKRDEKSWHVSISKTLRNAGKPYRSRTTGKELNKKCS